MHGKWTERVMPMLPTRWVLELAIAERARMHTTAAVTHPSIELLDGGLQLRVLLLQRVILRPDRLDVYARRRTEVAFHVIHCVRRTLRLLVQADEHLGERIDDATLLQVLTISME